MKTTLMALGWLGGCVSTPKVVPNSPAAKAAIENEIRKAAGKPEGKLTKTDLEKVKWLYLGDNRLTDVSALAGLKNLNALFLSDNKLTDIRALAKLKQLKVLTLANNQLTDVYTLVKLKQLEKLRLHDNPNLTVAEIEKIQEALPNCEIKHNAKKKGELAEIRKQHQGNGLGSAPGATKEIRSIFPNQIELQVQTRQRGGFESKTTSPSILIEARENGKPYVHAIAHVKDTPFSIRRQILASSSGTLKSENGKAHKLDHVRFLKDDPRVVIFPVGPAGSPQVKALGVKPAKLASNPFEFRLAFIMSKRSHKVGTIEFLIDPKNMSYLKVDRIFFHISGKFNPAPGDLIFSPVGELLGIMVNNKYCMVVQDTTPVGAILFGENDPLEVALILERMQKLIAAKPLAFQ